MTAEPPGPLHRDTVAVAAGRGEGRPGEPLNVAVHLASVYRAGGPVDYAREGNPSWSALEQALGALEGGTALAFAAGIAAVSAVLEDLPVGAVVVAPRDAYTGTRAWLGDADRRGRLRVRRVDIADTGQVLQACDGAALLWVESPTNPLLAVADLPALVVGAHAAGAAVAVDNTFATPLLQRPLALGADLVVHSVTKFVGGHSDLLGGALVARDPQLAARLHRRRTLSGAVPGALDAFLALRGLRTLPLRLQRAQANAGELARRLAGHPAVERVRYPGLPGDPGHARAAAQMDGFGAMLSFEVRGGADAAERVCAATRLVVHATSLGGVETTMEPRARQPGEEALPPGLIRLSVGCEHVGDLWADLRQALDGVDPVAREQASAGDRA